MVESFHSIDIGAEGEDDLESGTVLTQASTSSGVIRGVIDMLKRMVNDDEDDEDVEERPEGTAERETLREVNIDKSSALLAIVERCRRKYPDFDRCLREINRKTWVKFWKHKDHTLVTPGQPCVRIFKQKVLFGVENDYAVELALPHTHVFPIAFQIESVKVESKDVGTSLVYIEEEWMGYALWTIMLGNETEKLRDPQSPTFYEELYGKDRVYVIPYEACGLYASGLTEEEIDESVAYVEGESCVYFWKTHRLLLALMAASIHVQDVGEMGRVPYERWVAFKQWAPMQLRAREKTVKIVAKNIPPQEGRRFEATIELAYILC